ncbi:family S53 protease [Trametes sanguinea]|nr:family S53 protease [Trametes sanguinea]
MFRTGLVVLAALSVLTQGTPARRAMRIHESRAAPPAGFAYRGPASSDTALRLRVALVPNDIAGLEEALYAVSTPSSPRYGQYLSKQEVEHFVAPKADSVAAVNLWLAEHDINATTLTAAGDWLSFSATVKQASELLDADFAVFTHEETGETFIRALLYGIPADLTGHIELVHPTLQVLDPRRSGSVFRAVQPIVPSEAKRAAAAGSATTPAACASPTPIRPKCLQELYGIPTALAKSSSNHLGVIGYNDNSANLDDLRSFLTDFRPDLNPNTTFTLESVDGGTSYKSPGSKRFYRRNCKWSNFDTQYTIGLASGVPVHFIQVGEESGHDPWLDTVTYLLGQSAPPHVVTTSYAEAEDNVSQAYANNICNMYMQLGARGTSMLFASGDSGVGKGSCMNFTGTFPNHCPYVTSVGATTGFAPEVGATLTTGGFSTYFQTPQYQNTSVQAYLSKLGSEYAGKFNSTGRGFPDVSTQGVKVEYFWQGAEWLFTGTSVSSPVFASIIALLNDELITAGKPPLGFLNPWLYSTAASAFTDITAGNNPGCGTNGFPAEVGWDPVTGLGTPNYAKLRTAAGL